jgi:hypothetical protein
MWVSCIVHFITGKLSFLRVCDVPMKALCACVRLTNGSIPIPSSWSPGSRYWVCWWWYGQRPSKNNIRDGVVCGTLRWVASQWNAMQHSNYVLLAKHVSPHSTFSWRRDMGRRPSFSQLSMDTTQHRYIGDSFRTFLSSSGSFSVTKPIHKLHVFVSWVADRKRQVFHSLSYCPTNVKHHTRTAVQPANVVRTCILTRACALIARYWYNIFTQNKLRNNLLRLWHKVVKHPV